MNIAQIETRIKELVDNLNKESFIYDLLLCYNLPKASVTRLQKGNLNLSKVPGEISWKKKVFYKEELSRDLHITISNLKSEIKQGQRFIIVTDYNTLLAIDTVTQDQLDIALDELPKYYDFFLPWAGMEKATHAAENPADVKAAEKMAKLFDEIKKDNPDSSESFNHHLNIFFSRLLFCFFAEDTNIFEENQFSHAIESHTKSDGSDLNAYLQRLFLVLNTPMNQRRDIPQYLNAFPYVNGGLFREEIPCPKFTAKSRQLLIDSGDSNDWSAINPDIFGSMFQAVISPEHRGGLGAHYTSVPNIMKVIEPLFLNDLKEALEDSRGHDKKLKDLLNRVSKIKLFDPACGSGNFLIIAYKELRRLEMEIIKELSELGGKRGTGTLQLGNNLISNIHLNNFFGIELDDFAHEIAKLSLWLAEHQMNVEFFNEFGRTNPTLPLQEAGQIVCGNACRLDWEKVCPKNDVDEIYIMGNPPYLGARVQNEDQKEDMNLVCSQIVGYNNLDYISAWFVKGKKFIENSNSFFAFVTTNSICQGTQVPILWPNLIESNIEIHFIHQSFMWKNNAKSNAAVAVMIIGLRNTSSNPKYIFQNNHKTEVRNINPYGIDSKNIYVFDRKKNLSGLPLMTYGSMPNDNGYLLLSEKEANELCEHYPNALPFVKQFVGANELLNGLRNYCLWIDESNAINAMEIEPINQRIQGVKEFRYSSKREATKKLAAVPFRFGEVRHINSTSLIIPQTGSERRDYLPIDFRDEKTIVSNAARVVYNSEIYMMSVLSSRVHIVWVKSVAGRLKMDMQYSNTLCYNTFPFPPISNQRKEELTQCTFRILEEREKHPEKTLAELYDPDKMPEGLKEAHRLNDEAVERCYRSTPFTSDEERLEHLFKLYEKMIQEEKEKGTLFETEKKTRRKK